MTSRWVLASNNAGKLKEFSALFEPLQIELVPQGVLGVTEADEPHPSFIENAFEKARHASRVTGLPALADDSGLCVPALRNEPGIFSARYAQRAGMEKSDAANNALLIERLQGVPDRRAFYVCALAWLRFENDPCPLIVQTMWHGQIVDAPSGDGGFGYDPYFYLPDHGMTAAALPAAVKNKVSHRGMALQQLLAALRSQGDGE